MPIIIPANSAASGGFEVSNSLRFDKESSAYLNKTLGTPTLTTKNTISVWFKKTRLGSPSQGLVFANGNAGGINLNSTDLLQLYNAGGALRPNRLFRDTSAWYHVVVATDTTLGTADDRLKMYINGVQETSFQARTNPSQNAASNLGTATSHVIGCNNDPANYFSGYMSECVFIDGTALDPTSFGEFDEDSGIWKPIDVSGLTFGNNGFYLEFKQSGTGTDSSGMGADTSGNDNHFAVNNLTAIDQTTDTCTNNFATFNPIDMARWQNNTPQAVLANGALQTGIGSSEKVLLRSTIGVKTGKWYWEAKSDGVSKMLFGVVNLQSGTDANPPADSSNFTGIWYYEGAGTPEFKYYSGASTTSGTVAISSGDILNFALDCDNQTFYIGKNGTYMNSGNPTSGATGTGAINRKFNYASSLFYINGVTEMFASCYVSSTSGSGTAQYNFGNPTFTGTDKSDGNNRGSFEYQPPTGYLALCTANLSETNS